MKLGGSVLTDKTRYKALREDALARLARELARAPGPLALVHGAGSFGHVLAKRHALANGDDGDAARRTAFAQVHHDVRELDQRVRAALLDAGLAPLSLSTFDLARLRDGRLARLDLDAVEHAVARGFVPVLRGDGALDQTRGYGILSGDVILLELARRMRVERAVFVTDVDGVFDRDPREAGARLLARVRPEDATDGGGARGAGRADGAPHVSASTRGDDVTGGMRGKLVRAFDLARTGAQVLVVNGLVPDRLAHALQGKMDVGTVIEA